MGGEINLLSANNGSKISDSERKELTQNIIRRKQLEILELIRGHGRSTEIQETLAKVRFENIVADYKKMFSSNNDYRDAENSLNQLYKQFEAIKSAGLEPEVALEQITYLEAYFTHEIKEKYQPEMIKFIHSR